MLTFVFLISGMPTYVLKGISPYDLVFNKALSYTHLRVFGCVYFAKKFNNSDKLFEHAEKCVLLGYSVKPPSLDTNSIFVSSDVKFYEYVFPLKLKSIVVDKSINNIVPCDTFSYDEYDLIK